MSSSLASPPLERYAWTIGAVRVVAWIVCVLCSVGALVGLIDLVQWLQPDALVPVQLTGTVPLHASAGQNSYDGSPFVADGEQVTATTVQARVSGLSLLTRLVLGLAPLAWNATFAWTAVCAARAAGSVRAGRAPRVRTVLALRAGAAVLAIGTTIAQLLQAAAALGLGHVAWHSPALQDDGVGSLNGSTATFTFGWLAAALGVLAVSAVLQRVLPEAETE